MIQQEKSHQMNQTIGEEAFTSLSDSEFIVLTTFRKDGTPVPTTVWFAVEGNRLYVQTLKDAGKLKRIRNSSRVTMAPSDARGRVSGPAVEAVGRVIEGEEALTAERVLQKRYGLKRTGFLAMMGGADKSRRGYIEVTPESRAV